MTWREVQTHFPDEWVLIEAVEAHSTGENRIVDQMAVVSTFPASDVAMRRYVELHRVNPQREYYVVHTSRTELNIKERRWVGIRV